MDNAHQVQSCIWFVDQPSDIQSRFWETCSGTLHFDFHKRLWAEFPTVSAKRLKFLLKVIKRLLVDNENALVLYPTGGTRDLRHYIYATTHEMNRWEESDVSSTGAVSWSEATSFNLVRLSDRRMKLCYVGPYACDISPSESHEGSGRHTLRPWCQSGQFGQYSGRG